MPNDIVIKPRVSDLANNPIIEFTGSSGGIAQVEITPTGDLQVSSSVSTIFLSPTSHNAGLSGSLTRLTNDTSYLVAGAGISILSASSGQITISSTAITSPGSPDTAVQFNSAGTFDGDSSFTFTPGKLYLTGSFAQGDENAAPGNSSHAEGYATTAEANYSHAEGKGALTAYWYNPDISNYSGEYSHAEGYETITSGSWSHAEGESTRTEKDGSHAEGYFSVAAGLYSHAEGDNTRTTGVGSHAEGFYTTASYFYAHSEGYDTLASGEASHVEGKWNEARGLYSHAEGILSVAAGDASHAEGSGSISTGKGAHSEGQLTSAPGSYSHAEGRATITSGSWSHAEGMGTVTSGSWSHAEGIYTVARGEGSHAEGSGSLSIGNGSHAEGKDTTSLGDYSHAAGLATIASGYASFAAGSGSVAAGNFSFAMGEYVVASGSNQTVVGKWNKQLNADSIFVVGNGGSGAARSDILLVNSGTVMICSSSVAADTVFYVGINDAATNSLFDGNVVVSGTLDIKGNSSFSGATRHFGGLSGSLQNLVDGNPYLIAGAGITISTGSSPEGQVTIASTITQTNPANPSTSIQYNDNGSFGGSSNLTFASNTLYFTGSLANGESSKALGVKSHAEGYNTTADGDYSHSEGYICRAIGEASHAQGYRAISSGSYSFAAGEGTIASGSYQFVIGRYNKTNNSDSMVIVGNGADFFNRDDIVLINSDHVMIGSASVAPDVFLNIGSAGARDTTVFQVDAVVSGTLKTDTIVETTNPMGQGAAAVRHPRHIPIAINNYPGSSFPVTESISLVETTLGPPIYIEANTLLPGDVVSLFSTVKKDTGTGTDIGYRSRIELSNTYDSITGNTIAFKSGSFDGLTAVTHRASLLVCSTGSQGILTGLSDSTDSDNTPTLGAEIGRYVRVTIDTTSDIYAQQTIQFDKGGGTGDAVLEYISGYINDPVKTR